jgi:hypothetical protein
MSHAVRIVAMRLLTRALQLGGLEQGGRMPFGMAGKAYAALAG